MATQRHARITVYVTPETKQALEQLKLTTGIKKNSDLMNTLLLRALQAQGDPVLHELRIINQMLRLLIASTITERELSGAMHAIDANASPTNTLLDYALQTD